MKVCISGSHSINKLSPEAIARINKIMELNATILIGDAPGVDSTVQSYLHFEKYNNVEVWHIGNKPRHNIGDWRMMKVDGTYVLRDNIMCKSADFGLAIWDGKSPGTKRNIQQLGDRMRVVLMIQLPPLSSSV